jgi:hypothetical protein
MLAISGDVCAARLALVKSWFKVQQSFDVCCADSAAPLGISSSSSNYLIKP